MTAIRRVLAVGLAAAALVQLIDTRRAEACGCLSPPAVTAGEFAVSQSSEQIIFETSPGWVTAHVLIRYAGNPSQFAWLVPVPEVPDIDLSPVSAFGLLDQATAPQVYASQQSICPQSEWGCQYNYPEESNGGCFGAAGGDSAYGGAAGGNGGFGDASFAADAGLSGGPPPVTVINSQVVGDYQTVTFSASNATQATQWLHDNGFIVNDTTSIYMESYIAQNMVFVAAKLVPGAGVNAIKPLRLHYRAAYPTIPLILTAVAAQPNLTVTAFIYGSQAFHPQGHPVITLPADKLAYDSNGRFNYPMVLARAIDDAGGDAFAIEYNGNSSPSQVGVGNCCGGGEDDFCGLGNDGQCECPGDAFDANDCSTQGDLVQGVQLLRALGSAYPVLTRITTRVSPEEMTFDPAFEPDFNPTLNGPMYAQGTQPTLDGCGSAVLDKPQYAEINALQACAAMYCGTNGGCEITDHGPACECGTGYVATGYIDYDNQASVTCEPAKPPVDLRAGGDALPDACTSGSAVDCGDGTCSDRNGVAVCTCNSGAAAVLGATPGAPPKCYPVTLDAHGPGAQDYALQLKDLAVCAPAPPDCGQYGWDVKTGSTTGVDCGGTQPALWQMEPKGSGGCQGGAPSPVALGGGAWFLLLVVVRRRRKK
jgi:hypothetical protein